MMWMENDGCERKKKYSLTGVHRTLEVSIGQESAE